MKEKEMKDEEESEDEGVEDNRKVEKMSHSEGLKAGEPVKPVSLCYFEQQGASALDILFLCYNDGGV